MLVSAAVSRRRRDNDMLKYLTDRAPLNLLILQLGHPLRNDPKGRIGAAHR